MNPKLVFFSIALATIVMLMIPRIKFGVETVMAIGVSIIFICLAYGNSIACHRTARLKLPDRGKSASEEWLNGAMATRNVVPDGMVIWLLPFFILLALVLYRFFKSRPSAQGILTPIVI